MRKIIIAATLAMVLSLSTANASIEPVRVNPQTFILNAGNDLGKIQVRGTYYDPTPGYEYTNVEGVKAQMLAGLSYDNEFYKTRHITPDVVNGTDAYKYIEWEKPVVVKSLSTMKSKLKGFLFAYRKPNGIFWMDGADFTEAFFSGYGSSSNQTVIMYPIKEKAGKNKGKILGFMEYPCGNLVCRDTMCTDLIPKPVCGDGILNRDAGEVCDPKDPNTKKGCTDVCQWKQLSCEVKVPSSKYDQTRDVTGVSVKKDSELELQAVVVNGKAYKGEDLKKISNLGKFASGTYPINAVGFNPYSKTAVKCTPANLNVNNKEWCGDGIKNGSEQCDYKAEGMSDFCTSSCKIKDISCKVSASPNKFVQGDVLKQSFFKFTTLGELLDDGLFNGVSMPTDSIFNKSLDYCGNQKLTFFVKNPYSNDGKTAQCSVTVSVAKREFCGDGTVQKGEACDPKDGKTGIACTESCELKKPSCEITDALTEYIVGQSANFGISASPFSKVSSVYAGSVKGSATGNMGSVSFKTSGEYEVKVRVRNVYDSTGTTETECSKTVSVINKPNCAVAN